MISSVAASGLGGLELNDPMGWAGHVRDEKLHDVGVGKMARYRLQGTRRTWVMRRSGREIELPTRCVLAFDTQTGTGAFAWSMWS